MPEKVLESKGPLSLTPSPVLSADVKCLKNSHAQGLVTVDKEGQAPWTVSSNKMLDQASDWVVP